MTVLKEPIGLRISRGQCSRTFADSMTDSSGSGRSIALFCLGVTSGAAAAALVSSHMSELGAAAANGPRSATETPSTATVAHTMHRIKQLFLTPAERRRRASVFQNASRDVLCAAAEHRQRTGCEPRNQTDPTGGPLSQQTEGELGVVVWQCRRAYSSGKAGQAGNPSN